MFLAELISLGAIFSTQTVNNFHVQVFIYILLLLISQGILKSISLDPFYYFVHSYAVCPELSENAYAWTQDGAMKFVSAVRHSNVFGFQFHPEKSGLAGLSILRNFLVMCEENVSTCSSRNED